MARSRILLCVTAVILLLAGAGADLGHIHELDSRDECRLCQSIQSPELPQVAQHFAAPIVARASIVATTTRAVDACEALAPVSRRGPPAQSL